MKHVVVKVPFFMTKARMEHFLKGYSIINFDDIQKLLLKDINTDVYKARKIKSENQYPNNGDEVVAKITSYIHEAERDYLEIELIDSLYYHKLREPVIKLNGYCIIDEPNKDIMITKITRVTLADGNPESSDTL